MKHLIDKEKFLKEFEEIMTGRGAEAVGEILSKHLKDLPKKKDPSVDVTRLSHTDAYNNGKAWGYNQCIEDCEGK